MRYRRPHPVSDPALAARRLLGARVELIELLLGPKSEARISGELAVKVTNAIETLEATAENYGAVALDEPIPYVPVSPEELANVHRCIAERSAELEAWRRRRG